MSPVARPAASSHAPENPSTGGRFETVSATELIVAASSSRISSAHLARIASSITSLDRDVLLLVSAARIVTGEQIVRRFWGPPTPATGRAARRLLGRLRRQRLLTVLPRTIGGVRAGSAGHVYALDVAGLRLLQAEGIPVRRIQTPGERFVRHTLEATEIVVSLHEADRGGELDLIEVQCEPRCWRTFAGPWGTRQTIKPDLYCRVGAGALTDSWFIEVDLGGNAKATELAKMKRYITHFASGAEQREHGVYPRVLWAVAGLQRIADIRALIATLPPANRELFAVTELGRVCEFIAGEARS